MEVQGTYMGNVEKACTAQNVTDVLDAPSGLLLVLMTATACTKMICCSNEDHRRGGDVKGGEKVSGAP